MSPGRRIPTPTFLTKVTPLETSSPNLRRIIGNNELPHRGELYPKIYKREEIVSGGDYVQWMILPFAHPPTSLCRYYIHDDVLILLQYSILLLPFVGTYTAPSASRVPVFSLTALIPPSAYKIPQLTSNNVCLTNALHSTEYEITSTCPVSVRRPWTRLWRYLWTDLHRILQERNFLSSSIGSCIAHARPLFDCHVQLTTFCRNDDVVFATQCRFCVDYFNKLAELVFMAVFDTCVEKNVIKTPEI